MFLAHVNSLESSIFSSLAIVSLLLAFVILGSHWLRNYVYAFAAESWLIAALSAAVGYFGGYRELYAIAALTALFRGLVLPWLLVRIIARLNVKRELHAVLQPSSSLVLGALLVMFAFVIANHMNRETATAGHVVVLALTIMISMKFIGFLMLSVRDEAVSEILGLLVLESAQIVFYYVGEAILHCHPRLFFKHRGMEKRFEGLTPAMGALIAERISGVDSVAHTLAFCLAVEVASGCEVPPRARYLRTILAELERLYNHLYYLGHLCHTTTLKVGEAQGKLLAEQCKQINGMLTGSRFLRALITPGGLRRDIELEELPGRLRALEPEVLKYMQMLEQTNSHLDRLMTTGRLPLQFAFDQGATGPVKRASGIQHDLRCDHPYAAYEQLAMEIPVRTEGDAHARVQIRLEEIRNSFALLFSAIEAAPGGPVTGEFIPVPDAEGLGWCEGSRGSTYYCVHLDGEARLARVKVKSASFSNWRVFPFTVHDTNMMDYAINEASFGLTMAGCDR